MKKLPHVVVLSGAGMSAESGLRTFRDHGGLWEDHRVEDVATPEAWQSNPTLVLRFYNDRRKAMLEAKPNDGHCIIAGWEERYRVSIITQNVDDLHERAGSSHVLHLHGELKLSRSTADPALTFPIEGWEIREGDTCPLGSQLRPHIVWFGEAVTLMPEAERIVSTADAFVVVGTSLSVYPAASLAWAAPATCQVKAVIDPNPTEPDDSFIVIPTVASEGLARATDFLDMFL